MIAIGWSAASAYRLDGGFIRPAQNAKTIRLTHDSWAGLAGVYERVQSGFANGQLNKKAEGALLEWCESLGPFGLLVEELVEIRFQATRQYRPRHPEEDWDPADENARELDLMPVQKVLRRDGAHWLTVERNGRASNWYLDRGGIPEYNPDAQVDRRPDEDDDELAGTVVTEADWQAMATVRPIGGDTLEEVGLDRLRIHFPSLDPAAEIPEPLTDSFWLHYSESITSWLRSAEWMLTLLSQAKEGSRVGLERLASNSRLHWRTTGKKRGIVEWKAASAMSAMAFSSLLQLQGRRVEICKFCKGPYLATKKGLRKWCSDRCFHAGNKRTQRKKRRAATKT